MKRLFLFLMLSFSTISGFAQSDDLMQSLIQLWQSIDNVNLVCANQVVDAAYIANSNLTPSTHSVMELSIPFGGALNSAVNSFVSMGYEKEYPLNSGDAYKLKGKLFGNDCAVIINSLNNIVYDYFFIFDVPYDDFDMLKSDFVKLEENLNTYFRAPSLKARDAESKYMKMSAIKNSSDLQFGNTYELSDGMVVLHPTSFYTMNGRSQAVKLLIYVMHNNSLKKALNEN